MGPWNLGIHHFQLDEAFSSPPLCKYPGQIVDPRGYSKPAMLLGFAMEPRDFPVWMLGRNGERTAGISDDPFGYVFSGERNRPWKNLVRKLFLG
jgi:hypothetical protein